MENLFELLITVILAGAGLYGVYWLITLLKGKLIEPVFNVALVIFVVLAIVVLFYIAFRGWRIVQL